MVSGFSAGTISADLYRGTFWRRQRLKTLPTSVDANHLSGENLCVRRRC